MIKKLKSTCYLMRRELCLFAVLILSLLCALPDTLHEWNSAWFAMDYSLGLDSRLLIGSLLRVFYPDYLPERAVYTFVLLSLILLLLALSLVLGYCLRTAGKYRAETGLLTLTVLYLLSPGSPSYLWTRENFGRFDLYLFLLTLLAFLLCLVIRSAAGRLVVLTLAGITALSIHQAFMFIFFPLLFVLYADTVFQKRKNSALYIGAGFACIVLLGIVFLYFQFFSGIHISGPEELTALLSARTDLPINEVALRYEYFSTLAQSAGEPVANGLGERLRYGAVTLFLLSPLAGIYLYLWKNIRKKAAGSKCKYLLILLSNAAFIPAFVLTIDWGRWFGAFITVQFLQIAFLAAKKDAVVLSVLSGMTAALHKHPYLFVIIGLWLGSLGKFQATLLPDAPVFYASLYRLTHIF